MNVTASELVDHLVLVADNDSGVNALLQEVLSRSGLRTAAVTDGEAALEFIRNGPVSLLVCDLDMPKMGGEEVLAELRQLAESPPVLVISGYLDERIERELSALDEVRGVFRKPFDVFAFADTAVRLIRGDADSGED
jgi:CheY-like chemotaxis protein